MFPLANRRAATTRTTIGATADAVNSRLNNEILKANIYICVRVPEYRRADELATSDVANGAEPRRFYLRDGDSRVVYPRDTRWRCRARCPGIRL